jgi:hypothetical protein
VSGKGVGGYWRIAANSIFYSNNREYCPRLEEKEAGKIGFIIIFLGQKGVNIGIWNGAGRSEWDKNAGAR